MTKRQKRLVRFESKPADFEWSELVRLLVDLGFEAKDGSGSRVKFVHENGARISLHKPHPDKVVKLYVLREVSEKLKELGLI